MCWGAREGAGELSIALGRPYQSTRYTTIIVAPMTIIVATIKMAMKHISMMVWAMCAILSHFWQHWASEILFFTGTLSVIGSFSAHHHGMVIAAKA